MKKKFSVFAQNLAYYNEGELVGGWLDLPQSPEVIDKYLKEVVKVDEEHEEYEIADVDEVPFPYASIQWGDLHKINDLAIIYSTLLEEQKDAIQAYLESEEEHHAIEELVNICLQVDDIAYYPYSFEGLEYNQDCSPELKLGYTMAEETGLYWELQKLDCLDYFDFEKYGESYTYGRCYEVFQKGYLITDYAINLDYYSSEEIKEKVNEILQEKQKEREVQEVEI